MGLLLPSFLFKLLSKTRMLDWIVVENMVANWATFEPFLLNYIGFM